jgi:hypothetical protein
VGHNTHGRHVHEATVPDWGQHRVLEHQRLTGWRPGWGRRRPCVGEASSLLSSFFSLDIRLYWYAPPIFCVRTSVMLLLSNRGKLVNKNDKACSCPRSLSSLKKNRIRTVWNSMNESESSEDMLDEENTTRRTGTVCVVRRTTYGT